jgi:hypothetical protein
MAIEFAIIIGILDKILALVIQAKDEIDKAEKEYAKKRQELLAALASGDVAALNKLINEL